MFVKFDARAFLQSCRATPAKAAKAAKAHAEKAVSLGNPALQGPETASAKVAKVAKERSSNAAALLARLETGETVGQCEAIAALRNSESFLAAMTRHAFRLDLEDEQVERLALADLLADWQRTNASEGVEPDLCAGCGEPLDATGSGWRVFAGAAWVHYGGQHGLDCWRQWSTSRRREALTGLLREAAADMQAKGVRKDG